MTAFAEQDMQETRRVLGVVVEERRRQEALVRAGKFSATAADPAMRNLLRLSVLLEEVGEVARELNDCRELRNDLAEAAAWPTHAGRLRSELIQVAAVAVAWVEALDAQLIARARRQP